jgi:hypothetical protein
MDTRGGGLGFEDFAEFARKKRIAAHEGDVL